MPKLFLPTIIYAHQFCEELDQVEPNYLKQDYLLQRIEAQCTLQMQNGEQGCLVANVPWKSDMLLVWFHATSSDAEMLSIRREAIVSQRAA